MKIEVSFSVPVPPQEAWTLLLDVPRIVPCLPGASLTQDLGDQRYKGQATVKVGPIQLTFAGEAQIVDQDPVAHTAKVQAKGADAKGRGSASATALFSLQAEEQGARAQGTQVQGTRVDVVTDLQLVGAVAQYGRAQGLIKEIATQIVNQFADNLRMELLNAQAAASPVADTDPVQHEAAGALTPSHAVSSQSISSQTHASQTHASPPLSSTPPQRELSAFALLWAVAKSWLGRVFGRSA